MTYNIPISESSFSVLKMSCKIVKIRNHVRKFGKKTFIFQTSYFLIFLPTVLMTSAIFYNANPIVTFLNWTLKVNYLNNY